MGITMASRCLTGVYFLFPPSGVNWVVDWLVEFLSVDSLDGLNGCLRGKFTIIVKMERVGCGTKPFQNKDSLQRYG